MKDDPLKTPFECVEPSVGGWLWQRERPDLDPSQRALLEAHLEVCEACREVVRLDGRLQALVREGRLRAPTQAPRSGLRRELRIAAAAALAASVTALFALPPRPAVEAGLTRGGTEPRFLRPVEGEVVSASEPVLRWTPIEGVTRYRVEIRDGAGNTVWTGETEKPKIRVDEGAGLEGTEYRALLSVRPADLASPVPASVLFRSGSPVDMLLHRARWARPWVQGAALLSLGLLSAAWLGRRRETGAEGA
ncbi:MAG TPA: zf-HC2 domain-containing protein [bacterium]|nr:zf-HC2 domain-containing protein [bacterium]